MFVLLAFSVSSFSQDYCNKDSLKLILEEKDEKLIYTFINESSTKVLIYNYSFYNQYFIKLSMFNKDGVRCHTGGTRWRIDFEAFLKHKERYLVLAPKESKSFQFRTYFTYSDLSLFDEYNVSLVYCFTYKTEDFWTGNIESNEIVISDSVLKNTVARSQRKVKMRTYKMK